MKQRKLGMAFLLALALALGLTMVSAGATSYAPETATDSQSASMEIISSFIAGSDAYEITNGHTSTEDVVIHGDLWIRGGTVNLAGHSLTVNGNLYHTNGTIIFNKGQLHVTGDYRAQRRDGGDPTGGYSLGGSNWIHCDAALNMQYSEDTMDVDGSFYWMGYSNYSTLSNGKLSVKGDFIADGGGSYTFRSTNSHTVCLNGSGPQNVFFYYSSSSIGNLDIQNNQVSWRGWLNAGKLLSDAVITSNTAEVMNLNLNGHSLIINGTVWKKYGTVNLSRGSWQVNGDLYHADGDIAFNKGRLYVTGDYRAQRLESNSAGDEYWTTCDAALNMQYSEDTMDVDGSFYWLGYYSSTLTNGKLSVKGDFIANGDDSYTFRSTNSHTVCLNGSGPQNVFFYYSSSSIGSLNIQNYQVIWRGWLNAEKLLSDASITSNYAEIMNLNLNGHSLIMHGTVRKKNGTVNLNKGSWRVNGDLYHADGDITFNKGRLYVTGDYRAQRLESNSAGDEYWTTCDAALNMQYSEDTMDVDGSFYWMGWSNYSTLSNGKLSVKGDFIANGDDSYTFRSTNSHTVRLNGSGPQNVLFYYSSSSIGKLDIQNNQVTWRGWLNASRLLSDAVITSNTAEVMNLNLDGHSLTINGTVWKKYGTVNLSKGTWQVNGDLHHADGDIIFNKGQLYVTGDYRNQTRQFDGAGDPYWDNGYGKLTMQYPEDSFTVEGKLIWWEGSPNTSLSAGTLTVGGNFTVRGDRFWPYNTHRTVLNGGEGQRVSFNGNSKFHYLQLTKPTSQYVFNPNPCWDYLEVKIALPLVILTQPQNVTVAPGEDAVISVVAQGRSLRYQWYTKNANQTRFYKSAVTDRTYNVTATEKMNGRQLYCVITDGDGNSVTTNTVTLTVINPLSIVTQPQDKTVAPGDIVSFPLVAQGDGLTYQWYTKNTNQSRFYKSTVKTDTYSVPAAESMSGRQLYCVVTDSHGNSVTSDTVTLTVTNPAPRLAILTQPQNTTVTDGETAVISLVAEGEGLSYQWYTKNPNQTRFYKSSVTSDTYSVTATEKMSGRQLYCVVTDESGKTITSDTVTLTVKKAPAPLAIVIQPQSVTVNPGQTATISLVAAGEGVTYQWYTKNANQTRFYRSSVTSDTYSVTATEKMSGRQLYCVVKDAHGVSITSNIVTITVQG